MSHTLELPALDGRDPLGFLAALGVLRLLAEETGDVQLSFSNETAVATLCGPYREHGEVVGVLARALGRTPEDGYLPGVAAGFPPRAGKGADPVRVDPREDYRGFRDRVARDGGPAAAPWLAVFATDLASDDGGRAVLTPFTALSAKMNVRTFCDNPTRAVRQQPESLREALVQWRRTPHFMGEFLDHRAWRNPADDPAGVSLPSGVPGATWLAIMALPMFRLGGDGKQVVATLWHAAPRQPPLMVWPLWRQRLDILSVVTMIEHPAVAVDRRDGLPSVGTKNWAALRALGVFAVCAARRVAADDRGYFRPLTPVSVGYLEPDPGRGRGSPTGTGQ
jgi:CRISPR-associated endonuclease/helicase Cas3